MKLPFKPEVLHKSLALLWALMVVSSTLVLYSKHLGWMVVADVVLLGLLCFSLQSIKWWKRDRITFKERFGCEAPLHGWDLEGIMRGEQFVHPLLARESAGRELGQCFDDCESQSQADEELYGLTDLAGKFWIPAKTADEYRQIFAEKYFNN